MYYFLDRIIIHYQDKLAIRHRSVITDDKFILSTYLQKEK